jgi:hypothetical protein
MNSSIRSRDVILNQAAVEMHVVETNLWSSVSHWTA